MTTGHFEISSRDNVKIPVFANGNILSFNDVLECMKQTGCDGVMVAGKWSVGLALFTTLLGC